MKNTSTISAMFVAVAFLLWGCGSSSSSDNQTDFDPPSGEYAFYSRAVETTPFITPTDSQGSLSKDAVVASASRWESGTPAYEVFNLLREYVNPRDEGVIDVSNIYKLLFDAAQQYEDGASSARELVTPALIASPFDLGSAPRTFTHAEDHAALVTDGSTVSALLTWIWDESPKMSYGVFEGGFGRTSGEIELNMVYLVDYVGESDYALRASISGNEDTHEFLLKTAKVGTVPGAYAVSIIGAGISRGAGPDDYFLLKIKDNGTLAGYPNGRFFKVPASATEDDLRALPALGSDISEIEDSMGYADILDGMTFFALDGSDHAVSIGDFSTANLVLGSDWEYVPEPQPEGEPPAEEGPPMPM